MNPEELAIKGNQQSMHNGALFYADTALSFVWNLCEWIQNSQGTNCVGWQVLCKVWPLLCAFPIWPVSASAVPVLGVPPLASTSGSLHPPGLLTTQFALLRHKLLPLSFGLWTPFRMFQCTEQPGCSFTSHLSFPQGSSMTFLLPLLCWYRAVFQSWGKYNHLGFVMRGKILTYWPGEGLENTLFTLPSGTIHLNWEVSQVCVFQGKKIMWFVLNMKFHALFKWPWFNTSPATQWLRHCRFLPVSFPIDFTCQRLLFLLPAQLQAHHCLVWTHIAV